MHRGDLSTIRDSFYWNSEWYAESKYYDLLFEDLKISSYLTGIFFKLRSPTSSFQIRRLSNNWVIISMDVYIITNVFFKNFFLKVDHFHKIYYYLRILLKTKYLYLSSNMDPSLNNEVWPSKLRTNFKKDRKKIRRWLFPKKKRVAPLSKMGYTKNRFHRDRRENINNRTPSGLHKKDTKSRHRKDQKSGLELLMSSADKHAADVKAGVPASLKRQSRIRRAQAKQKRLEHTDFNTKRHYSRYNNLNKFKHIVNPNPQKHNPHLTTSQHKIRANKLLLSYDFLDELRIYRKVLRELKEAKKVEYNRNLSNFDLDTSLSIEDLKVSTDVLNESFQKALKENAKKYQYKKIKKVSNYINLKHSEAKLNLSKSWWSQPNRTYLDNFKDFFNNPIHKKRKYKVQNKLVKTIHNDSIDCLNWVSSLTTLHGLVQKKDSTSKTILFNYSNGINKSWWLIYLFSKKLRILCYFLMNQHAANRLNKGRLKDKINYVSNQRVEKNKLSSKKAIVLYEKRPFFSIYRRINRILYKKIKRHTILHRARTGWFKNNVNFKKWISVIEKVKLDNKKFFHKRPSFNKNLNSQFRAYNMFSSKISIILIIHIRYLYLFMNIKNIYTISLFYMCNAEDFSIFCKTSYFFEVMRSSNGVFEIESSSPFIKKRFSNFNNLEEISHINNYYFIKNDIPLNDSTLFSILTSYVMTSIENSCLRNNLVQNELSSLYMCTIENPSWTYSTNSYGGMVLCYSKDEEPVAHLIDNKIMTIDSLWHSFKKNHLSKFDYNSRLLNIIRIVVDTKNSSKNPYSDTLLFEEWCNETHLRVYLSWLVGYLCKLILCIGSVEVTGLTTVTHSNTKSKYPRTSLANTTLISMLSLISNVSETYRNLSVKTHRLSQDIIFSERVMTNQRSSSFLHILNTIEPWWCYKHIRRQIRWVHTSLQYHSIMTHIEHTLARYSNKNYVVIPSFYYKRKPPLRSAKLLAEYIVLLLKKGYHILKIYKKIRRWQWRTKWYRFYWKRQVIWKKDIVHTLIGLRIACSGPFRKAKRKRRQHYHTWVGKVELFGKMSLQKVHHKVDYYGLAARVSHASRGIKVWMLFKPKKKKNEGEKDKTIYKEKKKNKYK